MTGGGRTSRLPIHIWRMLLRIFDRRAWCRRARRIQDRRIGPRFCHRQCFGVTLWQWRRRIRRTPNAASLWCWDAFTRRQVTQRNCHACCRIVTNNLVNAHIMLPGKSCKQVFCGFKLRCHASFRRFPDHVDAIKRQLFFNIRLPYTGSGPTIQIRRCRCQKGAELWNENQWNLMS